MSNQTILWLCSFFVDLDVKERREVYDTIEFLLKNKQVREYFSKDLSDFIKDQSEEVSK